ncbi:NAD-dependent epimerase/dehydratase family protein [Streptomyces sp. NPDC020917]|uniref:NAD-dependent epimerase/dehydratase family protein n=1 Tax=Streptomyces sp. NPDC020917 TaxID=3365102 RepID=UPI0037B80A79
MTSSFQPSRVLVTGAAGLIGRVVVADLLSRGVRVTALVLDEPDELGADRVVVGDAGDPEAVRRALDGVDAVVHLAAMSSPNDGTPLEVFTTNTRATFAVMEEAGQAGIARLAFASSYSILGLPWSARALHPAYVPIDEDLPLQITDAYGLSKRVDEDTAEVMALRHGMTLVGLRFPLVTNAERAGERLAQTVADPMAGAPDVWSYLDVRDAAEACWLAITAPLTGFHKVFLAAPETLAPYPTAKLMAAYHPVTEARRELLGREVPIDTGAARRLLGFCPRHLIDMDPLPFPEGAGHVRS